MSSTPLTPEKLKELIQCSLCLDTFKSPKALKCLHTFCEGCLNNYYKVSQQERADGYKCAICKMFTTKPHVTSNFHMQQLIDLYEETTKPTICAQCNDKPALWKCKDCSAFLCGPCKTGHLRIPSLSDHKMIPIDDINLVVDKPITCAKHPSKYLELNCTQCEKPICMTCHAVEHVGHQCETIEDAVARFTEEALQLITKLNDKTVTRLNRKEGLEKLQHSLETKHNTAHDKLKANHEIIKANEEKTYEKALEKARQTKEAKVEKAEAEYELIILKAKEQKEALIKEACTNESTASALAKRNKDAANEKTEKEYEKLSNAINIVTYEQTQKIDECITEEGAAIEQMNCAVKCTEDTLSTTDGASLMTELQSNLLPVLTKTVQSKDNAPELPNFLLPFFDDNDSGLGFVSTKRYAPPIVHSRFRAMDFSELFRKANIIKTIDIDMKQEAKGYRIAYGLQKVLVCFWNIATIALYHDDGRHLNTTVLRNKVGKPYSAAFISNEIICVVGDNGLFIHKFTNNTTTRIKDGAYSDVFYLNSTLYALRFDTGTIWIAQHKDGDWTTNSRSIDTDLGELHPSSTFVVTSSSIYVCDYKDKVLEFSLDGVKLNTIDADFKYPTIAAVNETGDVLMTIASGNNNKVHIVSAHKQPSTCTVSGLTSLLDVVFQDHKTFWVLETISVEQGKKKLIKYVID